MENLWNDAAAKAAVEGYGANGVNEDLALCTYTTRLLGGEPRLVLHGGGNTSVKTEASDLVGERFDVLCVKGSGWDMATIEPAGLPAVKLNPLLKARAFDKLSDEDMVTLQRANLIDPASPNPSVETLLHAFLPQKFVNHTHSTAVLAIVDQAESRRLADAAFGDRFAFVPYIMPGFALAKASAEAFEAKPDADALILDKHGIFTFAETAKEAYDLMIDYVSRAEDYVRREGRPAFHPVSLPDGLAGPDMIAPILRGAVAIRQKGKRFGRMVNDFRTSPAIMDFVNAAELADMAERGVSTPDLSIRIKTGPMVLPAPRADDLSGFAASTTAAVDRYAEAYTRYFNENNDRDDVDRTMLDAMPRLTLVPGVGLFGHGRSAKEAKIAADLGEMWIEAARDAEMVGRFAPVSRPELFELEYWSLEQAKLAGNKPKPLTGQVALVTGGGGAIGAAVARKFAAEGAHVVVADLDGGRAQEVAREAGNGAIGVAMDVTDRASVKAGFAAAVSRFGGVDLVVSNAGAAFQGPIATLDGAVLRRSFELNFFAHQSVAQEAVRIMKTQGTGGALLFNASKQAVNPGADFGAYGLAKAATLFLSRQYALEHGKDGIRSNAVNADRIRSGLLDDAMIESRAAARGLSVEDYMGGNLLHREVTAEDVARAFFDLACAESTTANVTTVDGGNIAAALR
ncbi:MAG: bifunctional aldolase/short-chain dehydrogenase [Martelella sp.]|uniref:bifunctional aldolase/short-chain dehydrogenase n=1 Tax=unclassified Martelella TaxID=2629616 RepID=UPI000C4BD1D3|nr:bifunctional aldolase/short-chain dehydrogenase [Martelella sp.]MAU21372.1 bifunctional aldolase/short-chain dehydrogenase [Martelella sp.]